MNYTYVLRSLTDRKLYIGWTKNLRKIFSEHNKGLVRSTRARVPFKIVYYEACLDKEKAIKREKYFKSGFGRRFLKSRI